MRKKNSRKAGKQPKASWQKHMTVMPEMPVEQVRQYRVWAEATMQRIGVLISTHGEEAGAQCIVDQFAAADIVYGVWPEDVPGEAKVSMLKGMGRMKEISEGNSKVRFGCAYILCLNFYDAKLFWQGLGDGRDSLEPPTVDDVPSPSVKVMPNIDADSLREHLIMADENKRRFLDLAPNLSKWIKDVFEADLVYGVWPTGEEPRQYEVGVLKGLNALKRVYESDGPVTALTVTIPCKDFGHAEVMCRLYGDGLVPDLADTDEDPAAAPLAPNAAAFRYRVELTPAPDDFESSLPREYRVSSTIQHRVA